MALKPSFYLLVILSLFPLGFGGHAHEEINYESVLVSSLKSSPNCTISQGTGKGVLPVVHRFGPCSPNISKKYSVDQTLARDTLRVLSIQRIASGANKQNKTLLDGSKVTITVRDGAILDSGNYLVTVGFGTPRRDQTVIFDTGSDVNWIQCEPCADTCYPQANPIFDPSLSSSYNIISCSSATCQDSSDTECYGSRCTYSISYGDGSTSSGFLSTDTLSLNSENVFQNFVFGCGQSNEGVFGGEAGIIGLSRTPYSLNFQLASRLGNIFSYCIPSSDSTNGYLNIGPPLRPNPVYTPLVKRDDDSGFYYIDLVGISVGGRRLPIPVSVFRRPGTIIDSGTVITRLPPAAYSALRSAFRSAMERYPLVRGDNLLDTCYDFRRFRNILYPTVRLIYSGVVVTLPAKGVFYDHSPRKTCLAFAGNPSASSNGVIGNTQQKTFEVIYDNVAERIGFSGRACG